MSNARHVTCCRSQGYSYKLNGFGSAERGDVRDADAPPSACPHFVAPSNDLFDRAVVHLIIDDSRISTRPGGRYKIVTEYIPLLNNSIKFYN